MRDILYLVWHYLTRLMRTHYLTVVGLIVISVVLFLSEIIFGLEFRDWCFKSPLVRLAWSDVPSNTGLFVEQTFKLLPPLFLHGGPEHIFGNMIFLWTFGCLVADYVGPWWTAPHVIVRYFRYITLLLRLPTVSCHVLKPVKHLYKIVGLYVCSTATWSRNSQSCFCSVDSVRGLHRLQS